VGFALTLSPSTRPVAARPSPPAAAPSSAAAPVTSSPPATPSPTVTPTAPASVPPAAVVNNPPPRPAPMPPRGPHLAVSLRVTGPAPGSYLAQVSFAVTDTGRAPTASLTARLTLSSSVGLVHSGQAGGWNCSQLGGTATCTRGPLPAGGSTSDFVTAELNSLSDCSQTVELIVTSGSLTKLAAATIHCGRAGRTDRASAAGRPGTQGPAVLSARHELISGQPGASSASAPRAAGATAVRLAATRRSGWLMMRHRAWWSWGWWRHPA
jgi:hypothetical protein